MTPFLSCWILRYNQDIVKMYNQSYILDFPVTTIGKMDKCTYGIDEPTNVEPCVTVGYGIIGDKRNERNNEYERYHDLMKI